MIALHKLREKAECEYKKWRSLYYHIDSADFKFVYEKASVQDKKDIQIALMAGDHEFFKRFIKKRREKLEPFQQLGVRKLRAICKFLNIKYYCDMNKVTLVEAINNEVHRVKADSQQVIDKSEE